MKVFGKSLLATAASLAAMVIGGMAHAAEFEWKYYTFFNGNDMPAKLQQEFAADITQASGGRLNITFFAGGELPYGFTEELRAVATNQVQMSDFGLSVVSGELPGLQVIDLPFLCNSYDRFYTAMKDFNPIVAQRLKEKFGVTPLFTWTMPPQQLWLRTPISSLADFTGKKIRIYSKVHQQLLSKLGASGVTVTGAEVTSALDRGVIDGAITASIPANDWKFPEVAKYGYVLDLHMTTSQIIVNDESLQALPEDLRKIVLDKSAEWAPKFRERIAIAEQEAFKKLTDKGEILVKPSEEDTQKLLSAAAEVWSEWASASDDQKKMVEMARAACGR